MIALSRTVILTLLICMLSACSFTTNIKFGSSKADTDNAITKEAVEEFIERFRGKWNRYDGEALGIEYTEDGKTIFGGEAFPIEGRKALVEQYGVVFGDGSPFQGTSVAIKTEQVMDLGNGFCRADGSFEIFTADGDSVMTGKWGNVMQMTSDGLQMLQEAVFANLKPEDVITPPADDQTYVGVKGMTSDPAMNRIVKAFEDSWAAGDSAGLASIYTEDAIRLVDSVPETIRGRDAIRDSFDTGFADDSPFKGSRLSGKVLSIRNLNDQYLIANGIWYGLDANGAPMARGQWANLYRREGDEIRVLMENAGAMVFIDQ